MGLPAEGFHHVTPPLSAQQFPQEPLVVLARARLRTTGSPIRPWYNFTSSVNFFLHLSRLYNSWAFSPFQDESTTFDRSTRSRRGGRVVDDETAHERVQHNLFDLRRRSLNGWKI